MLASTRLDSTVTGNTLSCMRSLGAGSEPPKTMLCTLLYILRQVWNAFDAGCEERSLRYVWKSQKVWVRMLADGGVQQYILEQAYQ